MRDQGRVREAHDLLAPIYGWFTEGFGTKDLKEGQGAARRAYQRGLSGERRLSDRGRRCRPRIGDSSAILRLASRFLCDNRVYRLERSRRRPLHGSARGVSSGWNPALGRDPIRRRAAGAIRCADARPRPIGNDWLIANRGPV
jgi:hypothetical protein